ncbi:hypothetical protein HK105_205197 [Polyrhizophydium stewartii]|uniref:Recombination activating protein 1 n=1 Tax=Polyrhizophydium stewartii TaxID=2732419 RepID=A0ABR4N720_9FUNG
MTAGLRIHDEPSNRTGIGTIAADLHDIAAMQVDCAVEGDVAAGGANAAVAATGSAANMPAAPAAASKHKRKKGKAVQQGAAPDKGSRDDVLASDTDQPQSKRQRRQTQRTLIEGVTQQALLAARSSDQIRELLPKIREGKTVSWVKEHRTSKCCSKCGKEMQQAVLHKQLPPTEDELKARAQSKQDRQIKRKAKSLVKLAKSASSRIISRSSVSLKGADRMVAKNYHAKNLLMPWGVRNCDHCDTIWCRDKNARINMHLRVMFYLRQPLKDKDDNPVVREDDPSYLRPQQQQQQHAQA